MDIKQKLSKIVSGAQTGVDRAALDMALKYNIPCGGWCPKGRVAEDGVIHLRYSLKETESSDYEVRTQWNVRDSDGTLVLNLGELTGGTAFTIECAKKYKKHCLVLDLPTHQPRTSIGSERCGIPQKCKKDVKGIISFGNSLIFWGWVELNNIKVLNVAGPRESKTPGIYKIAKKWLEKVLKVMSNE